MFKIKLSTILSIVSGVGVVVTGYLAARGGRKAAEKEVECAFNKLEERKYGIEDIDFFGDDEWKEKHHEIITEALADAEEEAKKNSWKCYIPAIISGVVTLGCGAYAKRLDTKEIIKLTGALGVATSQLKKVVSDFGAYRKAVVDEVGSEKEAEIRKNITDQMVRDAETGMEEGIYTFHIDWLGEDLYFDAKYSDVIMALDHINKILNDYNEVEWPEPTVAQFFKDVNHPELITEDACKAGWNVEELSAECSVTWVNWNIIPKMSHDEAIYYDIWVDWYPWEDIMGVMQKLQDEGIVY